MYNSKQDVMTDIKRMPFLAGSTRVSHALRLMVSAPILVLARFYTH